MGTRLPPLPRHGPRPRKFTRAQVESLRDAADWPDNPPTSAKTSASDKMR